ncbi:hypothetical protein HPTD01_451 [Halomonas sp. TD01]|nr:hypothetical protein HPTD01_451 [Halomonas sp. TD01]
MHHHTPGECSSLPSVFVAGVWLVKRFQNAISQARALNKPARYSLFQKLF